MFYSDQRFQLHNADALVALAGMKDDSVFSIVTSPPYVDARKEYEHVSLNDYACWTREWAEAALPVVSNNLMLNLGRRFAGGVESNYHEQARDACIAAGWCWVETIIWHKPNANPISGRHLTNSHEYIYWLSKSPKAYAGTDDVRVPYAEGTQARYNRGWHSNAGGVKGMDSKKGRTLNPRGARAQSVFACYTGRRKSNPHPAPMPNELAAFLVKLSTPVDETVLDCFMGSGTTAEVALELNRRCVGIELSPAYCEQTLVRLGVQSSL